MATLAGSSAGVAVDGSAERAARTEQVRAAELAFAKAVLDDTPDAFAALIDEGAVVVSGEPPEQPARSAAPNSAGMMWYFMAV